MKSISIFASGSGSNAEQIILYFSKVPDVSISQIYSNKPDAGVLDRAHRLNVPTTVFNRQEFYQSDKILKQLADNQTDLIILAGFLWLIPENLLRAFPRRILNIHPALLPDFGGKGMYGQRVHEAVLQAGRQKSGITIHLVDEQYDRGEILFQAECAVIPGDTPETLAGRIHQLEHRFYPEIIKNYLSSL